MFLLKHFRWALVAAAGLMAMPLAASGADTVDIAVFGLFRPSELIVRPLVGEALTINAGGATFSIEGSSALRLNAQGTSVFWEAAGNTGSAPFVEVSGRSHETTEFVLAVPDRIERHFRGRLAVKLDDRELLAVVTMGLETAVASAVAAESSPEAGVEALRAQAVVSRSYFAAAGGRHEKFDFCDTTHCQYLREPPAANHPAWSAAGSTMGLALHYRNQVLAALFSRSCGGSTRSLASTSHSGDGYPYYEIRCRYCRAHPETWVRRFDESEIRPLLEAQDVSERARIAVTRVLGWSAVPSNRFHLERVGQTITLRGSGVGHGLGLCQRGAAAMAADGFGFGQILAHYFPNTVLRTLQGN